MADIHEIIDGVRVMLASSRTPEKDELNELHDQLAAQIRRANKRLRECDELLTQGLRSEAIQIAEQAPPLLDLVALLDFPELAEWNDFVAELGLTVAPDLQIDIASDLNLAYSDDEPLEKLLNRLRVYSLARAPLRSRIDLIRQIAGMDVMSTHWNDDLKAYEEIRLRQIKDESRDAIQKNDIKTLKQQYAELRKKKWEVPPPKSVIEKIDQVLRAARRDEALNDLAELLAEFQTARTLDDLDMGQDLANEWQALTKTCDRKSPRFQELVREAAPCLEWVKDQHALQQGERRFLEKVESLQKSLRNHRSTREELQIKYDSCTADARFDLPEVVQQRFDERLIEIDKEARFRKNVTIGGIVGGVVLFIVLGVIYYVVRS